MLSNIGASDAAPISNETIAMIIALTSSGAEAHCDEAVAAGVLDAHNFHGVAADDLSIVTAGARSWDATDERSVQQGRADPVDLAHADRLMAFAAKCGMDSLQLHRALSISLGRLASITAPSTPETADSHDGN